MKGRFGTDRGQLKKEIQDKFTSEKDQPKQGQQSDKWKQLEDNRKCD